MDNKCPITINEFTDLLNTNDTSQQQSIGCTILCCPIKSPILLLFVLPCTFYNIVMNKLNKKYIC